MAAGRPGLGAGEVLAAGSVVAAGGDLRRRGERARCPGRAPRAPPAGLDHLAFSVPTSAEVDELVVAAQRQGWSLLFADRHPHAGGPQHYAAYLEDADGFEVELVAVSW